MHTSLLTFYVTRRQITGLLAALAVLNISFLATTGVINYYYNILEVGASAAFMDQLMTKNVIKLFSLGNLASENVLASWYSGMLLLLASVAALLCFSADYQYYVSWKDRMLSYGWIGFSLIFALLSLDEVGSFHETIGDTAAFNVIGNDLGWIVFFVLVGLVALYMAGFVLLRLWSFKAALVPAMVGILFFASNPIQEHIEISAMRNAAADEVWLRPTWLLLLEEGSEIFGSWSLILAMLVYAAKSSTRNNFKNLAAKQGIYFQYEVSAKLVLLLLGSGLCLSGGLLTAFLLFAPAERDEHAGIAENWFPSAVAFLASLLSLFLASKSNHHKGAFVMLAIFCVGLSAFYASSIYYTFYGLLSIRFGTSLTVITLILLSVLTTFLWKADKRSLSRLCTLGWAVFISVAILSGQPNAVDWGFIAVSLLTLSLAGAITQPSPATPHIIQSNAQNVATA
ncbi:hypothetical protein ACMA1I_16330 [Pontibacter sp. 13R65]|uniref:hypothetical protein n=1 Tax=Pontibacter sp. 13R65 TaxID=3127458 RepID=UPI00301DBB54